MPDADTEYKLSELRHQIESEIQFTQAQLSGKSFRNIEILGLLLAFVAILYYFPLRESMGAFILGVFVISFAYYQATSSHIARAMLFEKFFDRNNYLNWNNGDLIEGDTSELPEKIQSLLLISRNLIPDQFLMILRFNKNRARIYKDEVYRVYIYIC